MRPLIVTVVLVVALAGAWAWRSQGSAPPPPLSPGAHVVSFPGADGATLHGELLVPARGRDAVVLLAGFGPQDRDGSGAYRDWARELVRRGLIVLRFDKRGIGESDGKTLDWMDPRLLADDATAAVRWLAADPAIGSVSLLGHSQGGDIALQAGATAPAARVVTVAAPARPLTQLGRRLDLVVDVAGPDVADAITRADPAADARALAAPLLIIHGRQDTVVPPDDALVLRRTRPAGAATEVIWLDDAGHTPRPDAATWDRVARFLRNA